MISTVILTTDGAVAPFVPHTTGTTTALVVGSREAAERAATADVARVSRFGAPDGHAPEGWADEVAETVAAASPDLVLSAGDPTCRVLAGAVAARLHAPVVTMARSIDVSEKTTAIARSGFGGIVDETVTVAGPVVVLLDPGTTAAPDAPPTTAAPIAEEGGEPAERMRIVGEQPAAHGAVDLTRAERVVAVGRGLKAREDIDLIESLARSLDAEIACSRPLAEGVGWFSHDRYVGVTGQHVRADLYLAVGISGQLQHAVGARAAGTVVAVNTDAACPYFAEADYCVVGDLYQVVPALVRALS